jgi:cardiolipin synthase
VLGPAEAGFLSKLAMVGIVIAGIALLWPRVLAIPLAIIAAWLGIAMLRKAWKLKHAVAPQTAPAADIEQRPSARGKWRGQEVGCYNFRVRP